MDTATNASDTVTSWPQARGAALAVLVRAMTVGDLTAAQTRMHRPAEVSGDVQTELSRLRAHQDLIRQANRVLTRIERSLPSVSPVMVAAEAPVVLAARDALDRVTEAVGMRLASAA